MRNLLIPLLTALVIGVLVGILTRWPQTERFTDNQENKAQTDLRATDDRNDSISYSSARMRELEDELQEIKQRLSDLEHSLKENTKDDSTADHADAQTRPARQANPMTETNLVDAGVSAELAADIMRRQEELEYQRMALRDRAIRGGYSRSQRYFDELRKLKEQAVELRKEIGDQAYDRYLFQTGQSNRVRVTSVLSGSPAAQNGIQENDILLRYDNETVFSWKDIRERTSEGQLGDYVNVEVLRDGQPVNLVLPRGPLGVKLNPARSDPTKSN